MESLKTRFSILALFAAFFFLFSSPVEARDKKPEWTPASKLKPGDKVCLWDIHIDDPLADRKKSNSLSLKYWYKMPNHDNSRPVYQMRPVTKKLLLRITHPGVSVSKEDKDGPWLRFKAVVVKGGQKKFSDAARPVKVGETTLTRDSGQTWPAMWQIMSFTHARVRKKAAFFKCERIYPKFNF